MKWTEAQKEAIEHRDSDTLISAAAGSGKTAVLVERIIQILLDEKKQVNIDELLVVTFTDAAAEEMRNRIAEALEKNLKKNPDSYHLQKQVSLIQKSSISTLHSFYNQLIRQYIYLLDVDPSFRIADEVEASLLQEEVMEQLFEKWYASEQKEKYLAVIDRFSTDRSDEKVANIILYLYRFAMTNPWPSEWLENLKVPYKVDENSDVENLSWLQFVLDEINLDLENVIFQIKEAKKIANDPVGPSQYIEALESDFSQVQKAIDVKDEWDELQKVMQSFTFKRLSTRKTECDPNLQEEVKNIRKNYREIINSLKDKWFKRNLRNYLKDMQVLAPIIETLVSMVKQFISLYKEEKQKRAILDFSDIEHLCLQLLLEEKTEDGRLIPSQIANYLKEHYYEILIDEYQDINLVQETILQLIRNDFKKGNMYMVGDVKQSIYGFRHADSKLFMEKYNRFSSKKAEGKRIDLSKNFRSRENILEATNFIFKQITNKTVGEFDYDENAKLLYGNKQYDSLPLENDEVELLLIDKEKKDNEQEDDAFFQLENDQLEARMYIKQIKHWFGNKEKGIEPLQVVDRSTGKQRDIQYRDIVILQRTRKSASVIMDEFKKFGIPVYADLEDGYFEAIEIKIMLSFLKIIDNPYQDIPLASILRSPIVNLNEEELAHIRLVERGVSFYKAVLRYIEIYNDELTKKLKYFVKLLEHFRLRAREGALADLIWEIYTKTGFYDFVSGMPGGRQRTANLRALYDRARSYEKTSFRGLFRFLRMIERMEEQRKDLGNVPALSEEEDVVRIISIHKSKGLEFPVVILGGLNKEFNPIDFRRDYSTHKDLGFAMKFIDIEKRIKYPTLFYEAVNMVNKQEMIAEEMRILYVAMTRAMEKLVMVGHVNSFKTWKNNLQKYIEHEETLLPAYDRKKANSFLDWIAPSLIRHRHATLLNDEQVEEKHFLRNHSSRWEIKTVHAKELIDLQDDTKIKSNKDLLKNIKQWEMIESEEKHKDLVNEILSYEYAYKDATEKRAKQSVSEVKRQREFTDEYAATDFTKQLKKPIRNRPTFLQEEKQFTKADIGTAMHTIMQHISFESFPTLEELKQFVDRLVEKELLEVEIVEKLPLDQIIKFKETTIYKRLKNAKWIKREVPFNLSVPAHFVYGDLSNFEEEHVFLQGIIDCVAKTDDGFIILDYKTDAISQSITDNIKDQLINRYQIQLNLYRYAVEQIANEMVNEVYLYFFDKSLLLSVPKDETLQLDL